MPIILFFLILLLLVVAHEFGHFIVAKKAGIRVDEFAFGFPPKIYGKKFGETTYSFNALPLGGYVKIYGENPNDVSDHDRKRSFAAQPRLIQAGVVIAGIIFNILLAWILLSLVLMIGIPASADSEDGAAVRAPKLMITDTAKLGPAAVSGIVAGDIIKSVSDGTQTVQATSAEAVSGFIGPRVGVPLTVLYDHKGETKQVVITPVMGISQKGAAIGIYMDMVGTLQYSFLPAIVHGAEKTYLYTKLTAVGIYDFISTAVIGRADFSQVTGPVGIVNAVGQAAGLGLANLILFTALISINLAVINVLPFPALDGGRLLFILIEAITRKPMKATISNGLNFAGFALLMLLMVAVTWHDIAKLMH